MVEGIAEAIAGMVNADRLAVQAELELGADQTPTSGDTAPASGGFRRNRPGVAVH
jgi:hypothetical protein